MTTTTTSPERTTMATKPGALTYAAYEAATARTLDADVRVTSYAGGEFRVVGKLSDTEFLVRGVKTNVLLHMRVVRTYSAKFTVQFTGYEDNGRDADGVMVDADTDHFPGFGWTWALRPMAAA